MELTQYIKELLYQHECVTLPGFGALLTQTVPIRVNRDTGVFNPPSREISFNSLIQQNDGLLANYVALREGLNYTDGLAVLEKEIALWKKQLTRQMVVLPGIGEFSLTVENNLRFLPYGKINFDLDALGLHSFKRIPLREQLQAAAVVPPIVSQSTNSKSSTMSDENKEPLAFTPQKAEGGSSSAIKYATIGIIAVALLGASYYFGNQYIQNERIKSTELAQKRITKNVQEATFDLGATTPIKLNVVADIAPTQDTNDNTISVAGGGFYSIIAGSYRDKVNAQRKLDQLKADGFDAAFAETSAEGFYRVAYGRFESKRAAFKLLNFVKYTLEEEGWYLAESK